MENQTLNGADGIIHFSYYLPDGYDNAKTYPLIVSGQLTDWGAKSAR